MQRFDTEEAMYAELRRLQENKGEYFAYKIVSDKGTYYLIDLTSCSGVDGNHAIPRSKIITELGGDPDKLMVDKVYHSHPASKNGLFATESDLGLFELFPDISSFEIIYGSNNQISIYNDYKPGNNYKRTLKSHNIDRKLNTYRYDEIKTF